MKYIVISATDKDSVIRFPFIFPNQLVHARVAKVMTLLIGLMFIKRDVEVTSAGEINSMEFAGTCYGKSDTLKLKSFPVEDTTLIKMNDYGAGMTDA